MGWCALTKPPLPIDRSHTFHDLPRLAAVTTRIHRQRATDGARNTGHEFSAAVRMVGGKTRELRTRHTRLSVDRATLKTDGLQDAMGKYHRALKAGVSHQQIAAQTNQQQRLGNRRRGHESAQVVEIGRHIRAARSAASAPADMARHRLVQTQLAAQRHGRTAALRCEQFAHVHDNPVRSGSAPSRALDHDWKRRLMPCLQRPDWPA